MWYGNVIREKFQVQFQYTDWYSSDSDPTLGERRWQDIFGLTRTLSSRQADSINVLWSSGSSGSARSPFVNIVNSLKLLYNLYNPPYCLSVWSFSNCKMTLILSLGLHDRFGLKVEFYQFPFLLNCKRHPQWISLKLHQKKFLTYIYDVWKENRIQISRCRIRVKWFCGTFFGTHCKFAYPNISY